MIVRAVDAGFVGNTADHARTYGAIDEVLSRRSLIGDASIEYRVKGLGRHGVRLMERLEMLCLDPEIVHEV